MSSAIGRLARRLVAWFPESFRTDFGAEVEAVFLARWIEPRPLPGRIFFRAGLLADLCLTIVREHRAESGAAGRRPLQHLWLDLKHTARWLARSPGFAAAALLTLTLGIGATTAMFSLVDGILLRPLLRIPVVRGRPLKQTDDAAATPVAVINETMARQFFAGKDPLGQRIGLKSWDDESKTDFWVTIVGVAGDIKGTSLADGDERAVYIPYVQRRIWWERFGVLALRTDGDPARLASALKAAVWSADPLLTVDGIQTLTSRRSGAADRERFLAILIGGFALLSVALVVQGLWSIVAYAVEARRREFGVRMALGARPISVIGIALRQAALPLAVGAVAGIGLALAVSRVLRTVLFQTSTTDPVILVGAAIALPAVALAPAAVPAWRATRADS